MSNAKAIPLALVILNELKNELASDDQSYHRPIDEIVRATEESLKKEVNTCPDTFRLRLDKEPFRSLFKDLFRQIVEVEKLEQEQVRAQKRKKLCTERLRIEIDELFDLDDVRICYSLGAVVSLTEDERKQKKDEERKENQEIVDSVLSLLESSDDELEAFCEGQSAEHLEVLHDHKLEQFYVDLAQYIIEHGEAGRDLITRITKQEEVLEEVLASNETARPVSFFAELVNQLKRAA